MKALNRITRLGLVCGFVSSIFSPALVRAQAPSDYYQIGSWSLTDTNWMSDWGYPPVSFSNLDLGTDGLGGTYLLVDSANAAWLQYKVVEADGTTNIQFDSGTIMFWFSPTWSSTNAGGTGPGEWGRLIEAGAFTTNASYGWWSIYVDPAGANIYFAGQTNNGGQAVYLSALITWTNNTWHFIGLSYSSSNTLLYLDNYVATNGPGLAYYPGPDVLTNGFYVGSDSNGLSQAHGMFAYLATYNGPLGPLDIGGEYDFYSFIFYGGQPQNALYVPMITQAPSSPTTVPVFNAVSGPGYLIPVSTNLSGCVTSSSFWLTNIIAALTTDGTVNVTFTIGGGSNGVPYDVFANSVLGQVNGTNVPWAWMGQGYTCTTYTLTNLPASSAFLILGSPQDSDSDGITDAYERLVTGSDPYGPDSSGDGMLDGWKVLWGLNPNVNNAAQPNLRSNYTYDPADWLEGLTGVRIGEFSPDAEGNIQQVSQ